MVSFLSEQYFIIKSLHLIAVICWMAGLLYLPRLFVYHAEAEKGSELSETLKIMERKLYRFIMGPASIATWLFGILMLVANPVLLAQGWMHAKLMLVVLMTGFHHVLGAWRKKFLNDANTRGHKFYRKANEIPTVLMIGIVFLAVLKAF